MGPWIHLGSLTAPRVGPGPDGDGRPAASGKQMASPSTRPGSSPSSALTAQPMSPPHAGRGLEPVSPPTAAERPQPPTTCAPSSQLCKARALRPPPWGHWEVEAGTGHSIRAQQGSLTSPTPSCTGWELYQGSSPPLSQVLCLPPLEEGLLQSASGGPTLCPSLRVRPVSTALEH